MTDERSSRDARAEPAREQDESYKVHGDKLDPIVPRGADQTGDAGGDAGDERDSRRSGQNDERSTQTDN